jgi:hypothetical protein
MQYLSEKVIDKMNDARLLLHYRICSKSLRDSEIQIDYYGYDGIRSEDIRILNGFKSCYVAYLKRILSTRGHVTRKATNGHRGNQRVHQK